MGKTLIKERIFRAGYVIRNEMWDIGSGETPMRSAYTPNGDYIGSPRDARYLVQKRGINPQLRTKTSNTCSIGYNAAERKWYGWSHRAIAGFKVGSRVKKGDCVEGILPVGFTAKTILDAKRMAEAFAESVS